MAKHALEEEKSLGSGRYEVSLQHRATYRSSVLQTEFEEIATVRMDNPVRLLFYLTNFVFEVVHCWYCLRDHYFIPICQ